MNDFVPILMAKGFIFKGIMWLHKIFDLLLVGYFFTLNFAPLLSPGGEIGRHATLRG